MSSRNVELVRSGATQHRRAGVWTLREDQVVRFRWYQDADEAPRAVGADASPA
jgi:hypothetical protein